MSEQEKIFAEQLNVLLSKLNDKGRKRLFDIAKGYEMCLRDERDELNRQSHSRSGDDVRPTA